MALIETLSIGTKTAFKMEKNVSRKKRKDDGVAEPTPLSVISLQDEAAPELDTSEHEALEKSEKSIKNRAGKSGTKRKSTSLHHRAEPTFGPTQSISMPDAEIPSSSDNEAPQEPLSKKRKVSVAEIEVDVTAPEPPSKKALRRLKKGKPLPPSKSGAESTPEPEPKKKTEVEKRSDHGVWIGNLPWSVSKDDLRTFLVERSDITQEMITRVHMPGPSDSKPANKVEKKFGKTVHNKGFAYVDFSTADAVEKAVQLSEQLMSGRRLLIKNQKSFEGRPEKTKEETRKDGKPASKRIFLGNLSYDVTEDMLKDHFEKCGAIESVKVATFEDSGKCKGYAWIVFEELEAAKNAVRGFVHIQEDLSDTSDSEDEDGGDEERDVSKTKKTKTRKWWLNKIKGRPLRMEFAEGADVRYKKRYGKDGTKNADAALPPPEAPEFHPAEGISYDRPYAAPRLTGGIVKSEGKRVTF